MIRNTFDFLDSATNHVKFIEIENNTNVLISIECSLPSNGSHNYGFIKGKEYKGLGLLPGERIYFAITDFFYVNEGQAFTITISEIFPAEFTKNSYFAKSYSFNYSKFSDEKVYIKTAQNQPDIWYQDSDLYSNNLRYLWLHNSAPYNAHFFISYKKTESDTWTDSKEIDWFVEGHGTDNCKNQSDYPQKVYDLQKAGIPQGYWVTVKVKSTQDKYNARSSKAFKYHPKSNRVAKYKAKGSVCFVNISYDGEYNLN